MRDLDTISDDKIRKFAVALRAFSDWPALRVAQCALDCLDAGQIDEARLLHRLLQALAELQNAEPAVTIH